MRGVRLLSALPVAAVLAAVVVNCGDDTSNNSSSAGTQPSACPSPCTAGALCYQPAPDTTCNGYWYCWDDSKWHCAPPDSGGPSDATVTFDTGAAGRGDDATTAAGDAEAGAD